MKLIHCKLKSFKIHNFHYIRVLVCSTFCNHFFLVSQCRNLVDYCSYYYYYYYWWWYYCILLYIFLNVAKLVHGTNLVLYCIDGVVIAAQWTATFLRSIVLPRLGREYADYILLRGLFF